MLDKNQIASALKHSDLDQKRLWKQHLLAHKSFATGLVGAGLPAIRSRYCPAPACPSPREPQQSHCRYMIDTWGVSDRNSLASGGFQIDMVITHRVGGDYSYCRRNSLEEDGIQTVQESDKYSVSPVCCCQQLLSTERNRIRIPPWVVVPVDAVFNFLRKLACDNQNWLVHVVSPDLATSNSIRCQHNARSSPGLLPQIFVSSSGRARVGACQRLTAKRNGSRHRPC